MGMQVYLCVLSKACPRLSNGVAQDYKFTLTASKQISVSWEQGVWRARHILTQQTSNFSAPPFSNGRLVTAKYDAKASLLKILNS